MIVSPRRPAKVLVVDDSAFMRKTIALMLESDPDLTVVGLASDGNEAIEMVRQLKPDLVTMDIQMPGMDGLEALKKIMASHPVPVMMVSASTTEGARATLEALELGAVDFIPKQTSYNSMDLVKIRTDLVARVKDIVKHSHELMASFQNRSLLADSGRVKLAASSPNQYLTPDKRHHDIGIIALGSSTGGPPALQSVISALPRNLPVGVVVAQHMPPMFTRSLAERLDAASEVTVREAAEGDIIEPGLVLIAPGGKHMMVTGRGRRARVAMTDSADDCHNKPGVDVLLRSAVASFGAASLGVIMTGMGHDGLEGSQHIKRSGGIVIAQSEATCVVYGMPKAVIEAGLADHVAPLKHIASEITSYF